jgi:hypothetical protein
MVPRIPFDWRQLSEQTSRNFSSLAKAITRVRPGVVDFKCGGAMGCSASGNTLIHNSV